MSETFIGREDLLAAAKDPRPIEKHYVAELKKWVWIQGLSAIERGWWEQSFLKQKGDKRRMVVSLAVNARAALAVRCIVNNPEERKRLYTDADAQTLGQMAAAILDPIYDVCTRLSGIGEKDVEELEQLSAEVAQSDSASS